MVENVYEGMFILDAGRYGRDPEAVAGQIPKMVHDLKGDILVSRLWEERRLAFPIKGQRKGVYWLSYFRLDAAKLPEIRQKCQLSETILRTLILKVDPRIVDTLVEHAKAGPKTFKAEEPTAAATEEAPLEKAAVGDDAGSEADVD